MSERGWISYYSIICGLDCITARSYMCFDFSVFFSISWFDYFLRTSNRTVLMQNNSHFFRPRERGKIAHRRRPNIRSVRPATAVMAADRVARYRNNRWPWRALSLSRGIPSFAIECDVTGRKIDMPARRGPPVKRRCHPVIRARYWSLVSSRRQSLICSRRQLVISSRRQ